MKTFSKETLAELNKVYFSMDAPTHTNEKNAKKEETPSNQKAKEENNPYDFLLGWEVIDKKSTQNP